MSFAGIAKVLSEIRGDEVPYITITDRQYIENWMAEGLPESVTAFALGWVHGINSGEWEEQTSGLKRLNGRRPTAIVGFLRETIPP